MTSRARRKAPDALSSLIASLRTSNDTPQPALRCCRILRRRLRERLEVEVGLLCWVSILTDDQTSRCSEDLSLLGKRLLQGEKQASGLATIWADLLLQSYDHYDTYIANCIVYSTLGAVNACVLETRDEHRSMVPTLRGQSWSWYKREKDGAGEAFSCLAFPKSMYPDISLFMESLPDLAVYSALTNDILSFYKEELEGDSKSYVNSRALYENRCPFTVLTDVIEEAQQAYRRVEAILDGSEPYKLAAQDYVLGSVSFHLVNKRYRLGELQLGIDDRYVFAQVDDDETGSNLC